MSDDKIVCTAIDSDWGDDQPNVLMHPPCVCPRCAPKEMLEANDRSWLQIPGRKQRLRVTAAELGATGKTALG